MCFLFLRATTTLISNRDLISDPPEYLQLNLNFQMNLISLVSSLTKISQGILCSLKLRSKSLPLRKLISLNIPCKDLTVTTRKASATLRAQTKREMCSFKRSQARTKMRMTLSSNPVKPKSIILLHLINTQRVLSQSSLKKLSVKRISSNLLERTKKIHRLITMRIRTSSFTTTIKPNRETVSQRKTLMRTSIFSATLAHLKALILSREE